MSDIAKGPVFVTDISTLADIHAVRAEFLIRRIPLARWLK